MVRIKAKLNGINKYKYFVLEEKRAVLPISLGNPAYEKEKFKTILDMISKYFSYCDVIIADTLQCHNSNEPLIKQAFAHDSHVFLSRRQQGSSNTQIPMSIAETSYLTYLFEEAAVMLSYFVDHRYHYILYPGKIPQSMLMSREIFIEGNYPNLINNLRIYFVKRSDPNEIKA